MTDVRRRDLEQGTGAEAAGCEQQEGSRPGLDDDAGDPAGFLHEADFIPFFLEEGHDESVHGEGGGGHRWK